ncbi:hypothetical protein PR048_022607 [Dryococelus australis]|uniref:Uncharacterized protein n=1 Tax=Dryococelus australis TaxID=614101 RepID=A0ABQ9H1J7_9NEOP|nr:hypothetical protein PR048_022607 [Dryococelus australis]
MQGWKREIPDKTRRPDSSSGMIPTCENPGVAVVGGEQSNRSATAAPCQGTEQSTSGKPRLEKRGIARSMEYGVTDLLTNSECYKRTAAEGPGRELTTLDYRSATLPLSYGGKATKTC